jgi:hypothetical protein
MSSTAGTSDGSFTAARFTAPTAMALSPDGSLLLVWDSGTAVLRCLNLTAGA